MTKKPDPFKDDWFKIFKNVHPICRKCYAMMPGQRVEVPLPFPWCGDFHCCWCGDDASEGIFYKATKEHPVARTRYILQKCVGGCNGDYSWKTYLRSEVVAMAEAHRKIMAEHLLHNKEVFVHDERGGAHCHVISKKVDPKKWAKDTGLRLYNDTGKL